MKDTSDYSLCNNDWLQGRLNSWVFSHSALINGRLRHEFESWWWQTLFRIQAQLLCFIHIWFIWFDTIICLSNLSCELWNRKLKIKEIYLKKIMTDNNLVGELNYVPSSSSSSVPLINFLMIFFINGGGSKIWTRDLSPQNRRYQHRYTPLQLNPQSPVLVPPPCKDRRGILLTPRGLLIFFRGLDPILWWIFSADLRHADLKHSDWQLPKTFGQSECFKSA